METREQPLVSVVLITRDRPAKLEGALDSLTEQTYPALELVVVDGSEESVESLVRRCAGDVPVTYRRDDGVGAGAARNVGMRAATGTYVAFLDDDDRWLPRKIERQVETFAPGVGVVYTGQFTVRDGERVGGRTPSLSGRVTEQLLRGTPCSPTSTIMVRQTLFDETGGFDEQFPVWEDREWYVRLSQHGTFQPVPAQLVQRGFGEYDQLTDDFEAVRDVSYPRFLEKHRDWPSNTAPAASGHWSRRSRGWPQRVASGLVDTATRADSSCVRFDTTPSSGGRGSTCFCPSAVSPSTMRPDGSSVYTGR